MLLASLLSSRNPLKRKITFSTLLLFCLFLLHLVSELAAFSPEQLNHQLPLPLQLELEQAMGASVSQEGTPDAYDATDEFPIVYATSHNDEMQAAPFSEALSHGIACVEVDVWWTEGVLLAGHETKDLSAGKTLKKIYLDPLMHMLDNANPGGVDGHPGAEGEDRPWNGIFPLAPKQEFMLMIDMKGNGSELWPHLVQALQPFLDKNYLTYYDTTAKQFYRGPLQIVGTGDTPIPMVFEMAPQRYIFYDAPLVGIEDGVMVNGEQKEWDDTVAPIASSKWLLTSYYPNVATLAKYSDEAHRRGIKARWWGVLRYPPYLRRALWNLQLVAKVDWINADDLSDVASFLRERMRENRILNGGTSADKEQNGLLTQP